MPKRTVTLDTLAAARRWSDGWAKAWPAADVEAVVALYADEVDFRTLPFRAAQPGRNGVREYVTTAFAAQDGAECRFADPLVSGDRAAVEYWGVIVEDGQATTLFGISMLRFRSDGLCVAHRDLWASREGRHEPPPGWGR